MSQVIRVVKCFQCRMYQTDIVKKVNKWQCKMCGAKQSLQQEYCRGTGKTCRDFVKEMNGRLCSVDVLHLEAANSLDDTRISSSNAGEDDKKSTEEHLQQQSLPRGDIRTNNSKWLAYVEDIDDDVDDNQSD